MMQTGVIYQPILMGILRHVLTIAAGFIAARGWLDADTAQGAVGLLIGLVGLIWSAQDKQGRKTPNIAVPAPNFVPATPNNPSLPTRLDEADTGTQSPLVVQPAPVNSSVQRTEPAQPTVIESGFVLSERSLNNLKGVHPQLVKVVELALSLSKMDFAVIEGLRTAERQKELIALGKSWIQRSKHQDGLAVDLMAVPADGSSNWEACHYDLIQAAMQEAAGRLGVRLTWGGSWKQRDLVHFQIEGV